ncbi:MAG: hypothetical protein ACLPOO_02155 [Terriglobales bacterium]
MPTLRTFVKVRSFRCALEPFVEFHCHRRKELPFVHSIPQVFAVSTASGISGRPDPDSRHNLSDSVDDLLGNALGFLGTGLGLLEAGVKPWQSLLWRFLCFAAASGMGPIGSLALRLFHGCHV